MQTTDNWGGEGKRITFLPDPGPSPQLTDFLRFWEGMPGGKPALRAYQDQGGTWTIGYGHTGIGVTPSSRVTTEEAEELLYGDIIVRRQQVLGVLRYQIEQCQLDALTSFCFNLGFGNLSSSTLLQLVNEGMVKEAAPEFIKWVHVDGVENAGLFKRRTSEMLMFTNADYSGRP